MNKEIKSIVSEEMKTKTMINREKRIKRYNEDIKNIEEKIKEEEETLEEEYNRIINKELSSLSDLLSKKEVNITLDKLVKMIEKDRVDINKEIGEIDNNSFQNNNDHKY